jgi:hypothetical protein
MKIIATRERVWGRTSPHMFGKEGLRAINLANAKMILPRYLNP